MFPHTRGTAFFFRFSQVPICPSAFHSFCLLFSFFCFFAPHAGTRRAARARDAPRVRCPPRARAARWWRRRSVRSSHARRRLAHLPIHWLEALELLVARETRLARGELLRSLRSDASVEPGAFAAYHPVAFSWIVGGLVDGTVNVYNPAKIVDGATRGSKFCNVWVIVGWYWSI